VIFIYNGILFSQKRMKFCHLQLTGWNWRISSSAKLARLRRLKIACSTSYADYRPKTNAVILLDMGHPLIGGIGKRKET
jgi:hypothetical protein